MGSGVADRRRVVVSGFGPGAVAPASFSKERVIFKSDTLTLVGFLFKPDGLGPFPALIWNHGSEQSPGTARQFDAVVAIFVPAGYVVFAPMRRGHGDSRGRTEILCCATVSPRRSARPIFRSS